MAQVRVSCFSISLDGYGAGPRQSADEPLGVGGEALHEWMIQTRTFREMHGGDPAGGTTGPGDDFAKRFFAGIGAYIMGRNMFGPIRGSWPDDTWKGWWGENPPYHAPVYVLTHHPRPPIAMEGGTEFRFLSDVRRALDEAMSAAGGKDVLIGGGVSTVRQYLQARLVDQMHLAISPIVLGSGEHLLAGIDLPALGYQLTEHLPTEAATHVMFARSAAAGRSW